MKQTNKPDQPDLFRGLSDDVIAKFEEQLQRVWYKRGEAIITEHSLGDSLYYIYSGRVEINKGLDDDDPPFAQLSILHPGEFFGEMSIVNNEPRSASAVALDDVELLLIPKNVFIDITFTYPEIMFNLVRTMSERLRDTNDRFVELMNQMISKNRLMAIGLAASKIIHDIKSPLTVIVITAQLLETLFPEGSEHAQNIITQTRLVDQMVREILDFARGVETDPFIQKVNLDSYFKDIKQSYGPSLKGRDITINIENKVNESVYFDLHRIKRVLMNLLRNSAEALTDKGEISITATLSAGWLQISVIDDGPGIPEDIRTDLFKPFITRGKSNSTGLGLAICKKIISEHKGRLEYIPIQPHGTRFDIRIPQNFK
ncbi:MAG: cyclic nucleotide-binding domain-containing protein [Candidatus Cloacimonetes bacterium]|nr:cyclic nucleotide-binding domain-containing protein [Candidatus Cloacimonadota bacterium]